MDNSNLLFDQPLEAIRQYFGEQIAFYFAWMGNIIYMPIYHRSSIHCPSIYIRAEFIWVIDDLFLIYLEFYGGQLLLPAFAGVLLYLYQ